VLERFAQADVQMGLSLANVVREARLGDDLRALLIAAPGGDPDNHGRQTEDRQPDEHL
jgi:hypothetical protein